MTHEELHNILKTLGLEFDNDPQLIYLFYETADGRVNNYSISVKRLKSLNKSDVAEDRQPAPHQALVRLMEREQPDSRGGRLLATEQPERLTRWLDTADVCNQLHTTRRTVYRWRAAGLLHPCFMAGRYYFDAAEVDKMLRSNIIQDNGRLDRKGMTSPSQGKKYPKKEPL